MGLSLNDFIQIPLEELQTPKQYSECLTNHYWISLNGNALVLKKTNSPQCNLDERIVDILRKRFFPDLETETVHLPVAYIHR